MKGILLFGILLFSLGFVSAISEEQANSDIFYCENDACYDVASTCLDDCISSQEVCNARCRPDYVSCVHSCLINSGHPSSCLSYYSDTGSTGSYVACVTGGNPNVPECYTSNDCEYGSCVDGYCEYVDEPMPLSPNTSCCGGLVLPLAALGLFACSRSRR